MDVLSDIAWFRDLNVDNYFLSCVHIKYGRSGIEELFWIQERSIQTFKEHEAI